MAWVRVPRENHPLFYAALPNDARIATLSMFGGVAATIHGHLFAGLFGRSAMVLLAEPERAAALTLEGAALFDPMSHGRVKGDKVMLPESVMHDAPELRRWIARAFESALQLPPKAPKPTSARRAGRPAPARKSATKPDLATNPAPARKAGKPASARKAGKPASARKAARAVPARKSADKTAPSKSRLVKRARPKPASKKQAR